jgi:hypothetical protein
MHGYSDLGVSHLHMHIISSDLCSPSLKNKKHYNSFHPKLGFFLHLDDVLEWFDGVDSHYQMVKMPVTRYTIKTDSAYRFKGVSIAHIPIRTIV